MNAQEAAQRIYDWFVVDGNPPSLDTDKLSWAGCASCLYRGPGGTRCAAGCLIPDNLYSGWMEGKDILRLMRVDSGILSLFSGCKEIVAGAQYIHDSSALNDWEKFPERFLDLCKRHGVTIDRRGR